jgi:hypothetical protein
MSESAHQTHHEERDISLRAVVWTVGVSVVIVLVIAAGVWWFYTYIRAQDEAKDVRRTLVAAPSPIPPDPRLQVDPALELRDFRRAQDETLNSYGWVSREEGRIRIPIQRAMDLLVERGVPVRKAPAEGKR